jgi:hypothetical protein
VSCQVQPGAVMVCGPGPWRLAMVAMHRVMQCKTFAVCKVKDLLRMSCHVCMQLFWQAV